MPPEGNPARYTWSVRGSSTDGRLIRLHAGRNSFSAGAAVTFRPDDPLPSAIDYLLSAVAADVVSNFAECARERSVQIDDLECRISAELDDPLASIGVIGARGSPAVRTISGAVFVSADAEPAALRGAWRAALDRSPLYNTLERCVTLALEMRAEP